jgi:BolA family transcriptional regulator, general stress-responsive regulator
VTVSSAQIDQALRHALQTSAVQVRDDSHLHAGHAGAKEGRHFHVQVISAQFEALSRVQRHRLVYSAVQDLIAQGIHALAIEAKTPHEV